VQAIDDDPECVIVDALLLDVGCGASLETFPEAER
jgi:hypothetical protein